MKSFVNYEQNSDFSIHNIPFGVAAFNKEYIACCTRIGDIVIDLATLYDYGFFDEIEGLNENVFEAYTLNELVDNDIYFYDVEEEDTDEEIIDYLEYCDTGATSHEEFDL